MTDIVNPSRAQWLRRLAMRRPERVALVLSGGGPLGALQVGALKALFETGVRPDLVVGTSVGAVNGSFVAFDPTPAGVDRLEGLWRSMTGNGVFPGGRMKTAWARFLLRGDHIFGNEAIRDLIESDLGARSIEDAQVPLGIVAADLETGAEQLLTSGSLTQAVLASTAMPGIYPPVMIEGRAFIDGGVANNVPIGPAVRMGASTVYTIDVTQRGSRQRRPLTRPIDYLLHAFALARSQRVATERALVADKVKLVMIPPPRLDFYVPFASMEHTDELIRLSYERTQLFLAGADDTAAVRQLGPAR